MDETIQIYKVCFDLLYDHGVCFTGMDNLNNTVLKVKLIGGLKDFCILCLQLTLQLIILTSVILGNLDKLKQLGKN
nr:hypothetical protein [Torque teno Leptonychotes weddellii virus 2]WCS65962.1 hypothetical protein [Torque teno Leptonychotes weddellii virus 2]WCS65966.1 hypothetical protein [Torque teno Leptonychotes weddellii virus 2]WCS65970.1 hypothetical protein [Torque teno Leptonychotes weddellii virus 2]WCS66002.1 hypothetical protein [Torque teno Leptonychotes weddellii virus 2]